MKKAVGLLIVLALLGCSGKPSSSEIEDRIVEQYTRDGMDEVFAVENFEKINGFEKGDNTYIAEVKYDLVFKKSAKEIAEIAGREAKGSLFNLFQAGVGVIALAVMYGDFEAGHRVAKEEKVTFIQSENGWVIK